jgi:small subunit ribosomal protein S2
VVGLVDTNSDPDLVDYVIPANDDAAKSVELIVRKIGEAVKLQSKSKSKKTEKETDKEKE